MELIMSEECFQYAMSSAADDVTVADFLSEIEQSEGGGADLLAILYRMRDTYVDHLTGDVDAKIKEQDRKNFLLPAVHLVSGLHILNGKKVPTGLMDVIDAYEQGCEIFAAIVYRDEYFRDRGPVNSQWIQEFAQKCTRADLCQHGIGPIFALAMAWIEACEREEARDKQRRLTEWEGTISSPMAAALDDALGGDDEEDEAR